MEPGLAALTTGVIPEAPGDLMALPDPAGLRARMASQAVLPDPMGPPDQAERAGRMGPESQDRAESPDRRVSTGIETRESRIK
jgi:hypothetical protein